MSMSSTSYLFPLLLASALFLLLLAGECRAQAAAANWDRDTLVAVEKDWGSPPQVKSWDPAADHCSWHGVTCGGDGGAVTELSLPSLSVSGSVSASVCLLKSLARLDLSYNNLTGASPTATLYACANLTYLDLSNNFFSGPLPIDMDDLSPAMEHLNLSTNRFAGEVPLAVARLPALKSLILDTNNFTGSYPAAEISRLQGLERLTLFAPAPVPPEFARLTNLTYLWMSNMSLTGEIPEAFASLTELSLLALYTNMLTGSIPAWVLQHGKLAQLTGGIPESFGNLKNLSLLFLYSNQFTGTIPETIGLLPRLSDIRLFSNRFSGVLPAEFGKHSLLSNFEVSNNNLSGPLPESLCANGKLYSIVVFNNNFSRQPPGGHGRLCLAGMPDALQQLRQPATSSRLLPPAGATLKKKQALPQAVNHRLNASDAQQDGDSKLLTRGDRK
ncbi:hypothetical protein QOZ80_5BG0449760 [Eleusine coracana subsp. coracana]|nr:hypothetical protein QOZ80_5BG0449760 [Eleusine coracana subsp. coracana]